MKMLETFVFSSKLDANLFFENLQISSPPLQFWVNSQYFCLPSSSIDPEITILEFLRNFSKLRGTKYGCGEGGCGACTVTISRYNKTNGSITHISANACILPLCSVQNAAITTIEGISNGSSLHPLQQCIVDSHGSQCGFCTPGILMSLYGRYVSNDGCEDPTVDLEDCLDGNLCRCTGYRPILDAIKRVTDDDEAVVMNPFIPPKSSIRDEAALYISGRHLGYLCEWCAPLSIYQLLCVMEAAKAANKTFKLLTGNTELHIERRFKRPLLSPILLICLQHVEEMHRFEWTEEGVVIGAAVSISFIQKKFQQKMSEINNNANNHQYRVQQAYLNQFRWFANTQIRNVASLGGNLLTASPISDLNGLHIAANCILKLASLHQEGGMYRVMYRTICMNKQFFLSYRTTVIREDEVLVDLFIPYTSPNEYIYTFKQSRRRADDIAIVNAAIRVNLNDVGCVESSAFVFGGMAAILKRCEEVETFWLMREWSADNFEVSLKYLAADLQLDEDAPGGMISYRRTLCASFAYKCFLQIQNERSNKLISKRQRSCLQHPTHMYVHRPSGGLQHFGKQNKKLIAQSGKPNKHLSARLHVTGSAVYTDDIPHVADEVYGELLLSSVAKGRIVDVDIKECCKVEGFIDFVSHKDVQGVNAFGVSRMDEELFAVNSISCSGQLIGMVVAESPVAAKAAMRAIKIVYEEEDPIISIEDAISAKSYFEISTKHPKDALIICRTENDESTESLWDRLSTPELSPNVCMTSGELFIGGQEHFYLETHAVCVIPGEEGEVLIHSSTQNPSEVQYITAAVLGIPMGKVISKCKRMGGAFGGKETRGCIVAAAAAVASQKLMRCVRVQLDRDVDMRFSGQRHSFLFKYKVAADKTSHKLIALDCELYSNSGWSTDLSISVMERALLHCTNSYYIPNVRASGRCCKTNVFSNTAFRGFGGPQSMYLCECYMEHISSELGVSREEVMECNLIRVNEGFPYGQQLEGDNLYLMWRQLKLGCDFEGRMKEVEVFNRGNEYIKRGVSMVPVTFGMSFTKLFMNQGSAVVHLHLDGSIRVAHGGTEMGQGIHTKIAHITADVFDVPIEDVHVGDTSTEVVANTIPTAGSVSTDLNGMAVKYACDELLHRLQPYMNESAAASECVSEGVDIRVHRLSVAAKAAHRDRVHLTATGHYRTPITGYDFTEQKGEPFHYYSSGVACTEVQVDCLTGDFQILRTDIIHDVGNSINSAIDIGQIEGAFTQGIGLFMLEETVWDERGSLMTRGPSTYKLPSSHDIPLILNVSLFDGPSNSQDVIYSSKGVGEPPLFLGVSVYFAVKAAINARRREYVEAMRLQLQEMVETQQVDDIHKQIIRLLNSYFRLDAPATTERIRNACWDPFNALSPKLNYKINDDDDEGITSSNRCLKIIKLNEISVDLPFDLNVQQPTITWHPYV